MKKKIAVIGLKGLPAYVGAGTVGENIINHLKDEFEFYVYATSSHTELPTGFYNGIYQKVFRKIPFKKFNAFWYYLISALHARYKGNFDLIHVHNSFAAFTIGILKKKYPVVLTTHGGFNIVDKWKKYAWFWTYNTNKLVKKADYLCCVSRDEQRKFKNLLNLDAHYIPNGINPVNKESLPETKISEPYIFFGSGRIIRSKGLHDLILALHKINYKGKLLVAGDMEQIKSYSLEIMQMIGDLDVEFLGLIKEKDILFSYISHARFFVYPSHIEAMSMMLLEAVTVECPIICSDIIPNQDILNQDEVLFFKTKNTDDLAEKISMALSDSEKMKEKALNARKRFIKEFNWTSIACEYKEIFNSLINQDLH
jgi:glycosyltransferase involved in cell wall biosynthesis